MSHASLSRTSKPNANLQNPKSAFQIIIEIAGDEGALRVAALKGGTQVYIPNPDGIHSEHWLAKAIGPQHARAIAAELGGGRFDIPTCGIQLRHAAICAALEKGKSVRQVALELGIHERTVRRHRPLLKTNEQKITEK